MKKIFSLSINSIVRKAVYLFLFLSAFSFAQTTYTVNYIAVGGGGGGGGQIGGGGGGGDVETGTATFNTGTTYSITVGAGGAGGTHNSSPYTSGGTGGNSTIIAGTTTITTAYGGGGGGTGNAGLDGTSGGSGGGGAYYYTVAGSAGSGSNVNAGGAGYNATNAIAGGGGGAGGAGQAAATVNNNTAGNGGAGYQPTNISGITAYFGGGGGGGAETPSQVAGTGGSGGGGNGADGGNGYAGSANTGGGGGGAEDNAVGGAGGSGVVIIAFPTGSFNYSTSGSVSTSGANTLITFNSSGTFSASPNPPTITLSPTSAAICIGNTTSLTASGAVSYTWSPTTGLDNPNAATVNANPSSTTTYTVSGTNVNGTGTNTITVTVNPLPSLSISPNTPVVQGGQGATIVASGASTYTWSPATNLSATTGATVTATPQITTHYTVTGTNSNGCVNSMKFSVGIELWQQTADTANAPIYYQGKIGIGNTNPTTNLDVTGSAKVTGTLTANAIGAVNSNLGISSPAVFTNTVTISSLAGNSAGGPVYVDSLGNLRINPVNPCIGCTTAVVPLCNTGNPAWLIGGNTISPISNARIGTCDNNPFIMETYGVERMRITAAGNVYVGIQYPRNTPYNNALFTVNGQLVAKEMYVEVADWADYVFKKEYKLMPLSEVEKYYKANQHLPEVPSEKEVKEKGMNVSEMNSVLLKKIEELTLYMVQQQKENMELKTKVKQLEEKLNR